MQNTYFAVTVLGCLPTHDSKGNAVQCVECLDHAENAAINARVMGSKVANYGDAHHFATVQRVISLVTLSAAV